jgi:hypothetical protein
MLISKLPEKPLHILKSPVECISSFKDRKFHNVIFFFGYKPEDFKNFLTSKMFFLKDYSAVYFPKTLPLLNGNLQINRSAYYKDILEEYPNISIVRNSLEQYKEKNLIIDMTLLFRVFNNKVNLRGLNKYKAMDNFFRQFIEDPGFSKYNKFFFVSLDLREEEYNKLDYDTSDDFLKGLILNQKSFGTVRSPINNIDFKNILKMSCFNNKHVLPVSYFHTKLEEKEKGIVTNPGYERGKIVFFNTDHKYLHYVSLSNPLPYAKIKGKTLRILKIVNGKISELEKDETELAVSVTKPPAIEDPYLPPKKTLTSVMSDIKKKFNIVDPSVDLSALGQEKFNAVQTKVQKIEDELQTEDPAAIKAEIDKDPELLQDLADLKTLRNTATQTEVEQKIISKAKESRKNLKVSGHNYDEIVSKHQDTTIHAKEFPVELLHKEYQHSSLMAMDEQYINEVLDQDLMKIFSAFENDPEDPMIVQDISIEDSSDKLSFKKRYTVKYKNKHNKTFTIRVDIPEIIDSKFFYLNGGKKTLTKQIVSLPIIKNKPDEVFVCSNYNKFQINKKGNKLDRKSDGFIKVLNTHRTKIERSGVKIEVGNNLRNNSKFINTSQYNYLSLYYNEFKFKDGLIISFNRKRMSVSSAKKFPTLFPIAYNNNKKIIYYLSIEDESVFADSGKILTEATIPEIKETKDFVKVSDNLLDFLIERFDTVFPMSQTLNEELVNSGKNFVYSTIGILKRRISVLMLLAFYKGFFNLLDMYAVDYRITEKREKLNPDEKLERIVVPFKDYNLVYKSNSKNNMLLHALSEIPTREYNVHDLNSTEFYLDYFEDTYKSRNVAKGFKLILDRMIDPITFEVLEELKLPTTITELILEANTMLSNVKFSQKNHMSNYRIRGMETLPVILFRTLAAEFNIYRMNGSFSVPVDRVIKNLLSENIVNEYSVLNVPNELMENSVASWKGPGGINSSDAYTADIRSYDESMLGILGAFSPIDNKVGTVRHLSYNTKIKTTRGFIEINDKDADLDATQLFSPAELINPFNATMSDPMRTAYNVRQTAHIIPTVETDAPLIGTGVEKTIPYLLGSDFIYVAKEDGKIKEIDTKHKLMVISYKDGSEDVISLGENISKNSQGGFFINNHLETTYKAGKSFKKGDILAKNNSFFKGTDKDPMFAMGTLAKVAMVCLDGTMEDGSFITEKLSNKLTSFVTMQEELVLGTDSNIKSIVKVGDHVTVGDSLAVFETIFNDTDAVNLVDKIGDKYQETIKDLAFTSKKAHYSGEIVDIRIYFNRELEDFSPSVRKIIKQYISEITEKEKKIKTINLKGHPNILLPSTEKYTSETEGKIKGKDVNGILIEFYIRHADKMHLGDKITFQGACKTIVSETIVDAEAPFSEFHKDENIDAIFSPLSLVTRMTLDIPNNMLGNKVLVELKRKVKEIYEKN